MIWNGVMPAMTTAFDKNLNVDHAFMAKHAQQLIEAGCTGLVMLGSLGEAATLEAEEKRDILSNVKSVVGKNAPVVAAISALSTRQATRLAEMAADLGCDGLMVLPPYVYQGDWRETKHHISAIFRSTTLSCMLYNNPIAYGTDFTPEQIAELAGEHANFEAVKESSADVRRVSAIRALLGDRLAVFVGVDDVILEACAAGACGWIAGLVNAFPVESVQLFNLCAAARFAEATALYRWFLPLLRMDTVPKFVQLIKLVQELAGMGSARVRPPRLELAGEELDAAKATFERALEQRPKLAAFAQV
ncbi:MAG TPA: dihydrodipicolinate synthase family protein [Bryobacteraceae bacterium]|jgi:4-hydroxy-tetrahydrodipicolinate synthase|nr:dihydrodipicolinate synthase family protein [Bryobacteraceae bacterium]